VGHSRGASQHRLEQWGERVLRLQQRRNQERCGPDGYKELQPNGALGIVTLRNRWIVVICKRMGMSMPAEVSMHPSCPVVTLVVMVVVVEMRVQQGRTKCRQLQGHDGRDRHEGAKHPPIVVPRIQRFSELFVRSRCGWRPCARIRGMRTIQWLFVVGVLLFITGIGFVIAGAREARSAAPEAEAAPITAPVASVKQIMAAITGPAANTVYNSVGTIVSVDGIKETAPQNDEEWAALAATAASLAESGNLLLTPGRAIDNGDWVKMTQDFIDKSTAAMKAAEQKSTEAILSTGSDLNETCDTCHEKYQRQ
jgi:hypothetical protein